MAKVGYRRVSSDEQSLERQDLIGCEKVFEEKASAGGGQDRAALSDMIAWVRDGDEVCVHSIDRLARNLSDLQKIIAVLNGKGVTISFLSERLTFSASTEDALARLQLQMMGAFAEFERAIIRKRQSEGIAKAKARGVYKGRQARIDPKKIANLKAQGLGASGIAKQLRIGRASVYRALK
jgi:DNA invertase Pin-like site-specific DNA recombinase